MSKLAVLVGLACVACSSPSSREPVQKPRPVPAGPHVSHFVTPETVAVFAYKLDMFPLKTLGADLGANKEACWADIEGGISRIYQITSPSNGGFEGFFVLDMKLGRDAVEACLEKALRAKVAREGDVSSISVTGAAGSAYLGWRDRYVIAGTRAEVTRALGQPAATNDWRARIDAMSASAPVHGVTTSPLFDKLLGVPSKLLELIIEDAGGKHAVQLRSHYASAADAATAKKKLGAGELDFLEMPASLRAQLAKLRTEVVGSTLAVHLDPEVLAGIDRDAALGWLVAAQAKVFQK